MRFSRIIMIAALIAGAAFLSACTVTTSPSDSSGQDGVVADSGDSDSWWNVADEGDGDEYSGDTDAVDVQDPDDTAPAKDADPVADEVQIVGDSEVSAAVSGSFTKQFTASPSGAGLSYTWDVQGAPDWAVIEEGGSSKQNLELSAASIPGTASNQTYNITLKAKEAGGAEATFALVVKVEQFILPVLPVTVENPCDKALGVEVVSYKASDGSTVSCSTTDCFNQNGELDSAREITFRINGGKAPYAVGTESYVEDSFHCRRRIANDGESRIREYQEEESYFFADKESECRDKYDNTLPSARTVNTTWRSDDVAQDQYNDLASYVDGTTDKTTFTIKGKLRYHGPLPISLLPKASDGFDDATQLPIENLIVTVKDSCEPKPIPAGGEKSLTLTRRAVSHIKIGVIYPEEDKIEDLRFSMAFLGEAYGSFAKASVYFGDETLYSFQEMNEHSLAGARITSILDLDYHEGYTCYLPPDWPDDDRYCVTDAKDAVTHKAYDTDSDELRHIIDILAIFNGQGPHVSSGAGCPSGSDNDCIIESFPLEWLRFESDYWRAQWTDVGDEIGGEFWTEAQKDKRVAHKGQLYEGMSMPTYLNSNDNGDTPYTLFQRREVPVYRD